MLSSSFYVGKAWGREWPEIPLSSFGVGYLLLGLRPAHKRGLLLQWVSTFSLKGISVPAFQKAGIKACGALYWASLHSYASLRTWELRVMGDCLRTEQSFTPPAPRVEKQGQTKDSAKVWHRKLVRLLTLLARGTEGTTCRSMEDTKAAPSQKNLPCFWLLVRAAPLVFLTKSFFLSL